MQTVLTPEQLARRIDVYQALLLDDALNAYVAGSIDPVDWARRQRSARSEAVKRERADRRRVSRPIRDAVLASGSCAYCGYWADTIDHIVPIAQGGTSDRANLAAACQPCNWNKLDFTPEEWKAYRAEVGLPWPPLTRWQVFQQIVAEQHAKAAAR